MGYLDWSVIALVCVAAGAYGALIGAGGGFALTPILLMLFDDIAPERVAGTVLAGIALNSALVTWKYRKESVIDWRSGLLFALAAAPGAAIGALGVGAVAPEAFKVAFGALLVALAVYLAVEPRLPEDAPPDDAADAPPRYRISVMRTSRRIRTRDGREYRYEFDEGLTTLFNIALGFMSSFFGIGGGVLRTPILVKMFGFPVRIAAATSIFALSIYGSAGAAAHAALGHIELSPLLAVSAVGLVVGGQIGARLSGKVRGVWVLRLLVVVVLALGARLIWEGLAG